ncbi:MAG: D-aminoacyl-tRNA deacylase [Firmicutes bacterium]|jgi:D-tyrosyl-tRNA(Tyr) deacylase|nr:D-aminoacyl-tRNA deacylase [Bacillota bacterium]
MRAVVQRVSSSKVTVDGETYGKIDLGLNVLIGVESGDTEKDLDYIFDKVVNLRIFEDENEKLNLSVKDVDGEILAISQFTLAADCRKGRRPSFSNAARPEAANVLYEKFVDKVKEEGIKVETGKFQSHMVVDIVNDGPVTILLDSKKVF